MILSKLIVGMGTRILFTITASLLITCGIQEGILPQAGSASEAGNSSIACLTDSLFIRVPTSAKTNSVQISDKPLGKMRSTEEVELCEIVRGYIGIADELVHNEKFGLITLINFYRDSLPWGDIKKNYLMSGTMNNTRWIATYSVENEFHYGVAVFIDSAGKELPVFYLLFNGNFIAPKGEAYYRIDLIVPQIIKYPLYINVKFSASPGQRRLDISAISEKPLADFSDGFRKLYMQLYETNGVLHISGASYHPNLVNLLPGTTEYCFEFYGFSDMAANRSLLHIGIPPADIDSDDPELFSKYSMSSVLLQHIIQVDIQEFNDTLKRCIVTSYRDSLSLETVLDSVENSGTEWLHSSDELSTMTFEELDLFLELNESTESEYILNLIRMRKLKQPFYFDGNGYAGNGPDAPDGFSALAATSRILDIQSPHTVKMIRIVP